jgi:SagB-type dehydrogenase family enzyme
MTSKIHVKTSPVPAASAALAALLTVAACSSPPPPPAAPTARECPPCPEPAAAAEPVPQEPGTRPPPAVIEFVPGEPVALPAPRLDRGLPLMRALAERRSGREFAPDGLDLQTLGELLWAGWGINRRDAGKRTAPSARNWQDMKLYVALPAGLFLYDAAAHALVPRVAGDLRAATGKQDFVGSAPLNLVFVSDYDKLASAPDERKQTYAGAHAGFIVQNVYLYCASEGLAAVVRAHFDGAELAAAMQLPDNEHVVLVQTVGWPAAPAAD